MQNLFGMNCGHLGQRQDQATMASRSAQGAATHPAISSARPTASLAASGGWLRAWTSAPVGRASPPAASAISATTNSMPITTCAKFIVAITAPGTGAPR